MLGNVPLPARVLGLAGLLPFLAGTLLVLVTHDPRAFTALLAYGATILSFMGGVHWGAAMLQARPSWSRLGCSVVSALAAWAGLLLPTQPGALVLALSFAVLLAYDLASARRGDVPGWYPSLRWPLTATVVLCLLVATLIW